MQKLQLAIPEPCHENWQQMTPTDQGRFCNACAKEVIDFSTMTDIQVLNYFTNMTHEKVCGRALPEQLDRTISRPTQPKKRLFWYWNYIVMFCMVFTKGNAANAQTCTKPATELNPVKNLDVRGEVITMGGVKREGSRVIIGKVTDIDGNPVSFASVKIKGTSTGVSADANGAYSIIIKPNAILVISGASFKDTEVPVGTQSVVNTVMEKRSNMNLQGDVVVTYAGGMGYRNMDEYYGPLDKLKRVAVLQVKDETTGKAIPNASLIVQSDYNDIADTALTDKKGMYKIKNISDYDKYEIKVSANGYESSEFAIDENDFKDRKKTWEILLRKQKPEVVRLNAVAKIGKETIVRLGQVSANTVKGGGLYVVDGIIMPSGADINPDDVEDYSFLQGPAATALFGSAGANGAVVITTKKLKIKNLDTVAVTAYGVRTVGRTVGRLVCTTTTTTSSVMGSMVKGVTIKSTIADTLKIIATKINGAIKLYPNPVQCGEQFSIALKLKRAGLYQVQINDATGRIVLTKQINANAKDFTEKILADNRWSSGVYYISIIDEKNNLINKSSFIVR